MILSVEESGKLLNMGNETKTYIVNQNQKWEFPKAVLSLWGVEPGQEVSDELFVQMITSVWRKAPERVEREIKGNKKMNTDSEQQLKQAKVDSIIQSIVDRHGKEAVSLIKAALQKCGYSFCECRRKNENTD